MTIKDLEGGIKIEDTDYKGTLTRDEDGWYFECEVNTKFKNEHNESGKNTYEIDIDCYVTDLENKVKKNAILKAIAYTLQAQAHNLNKLASEILYHVK